MSDDDQNIGPAPDRVDDPRGNLRADHGDAYTLQEVIGDIIDNSIDASSPDGTVTVEVFFEECDYTDEEKEWKYLAGKLDNFLIENLIPLKHIYLPLPSIIASLHQCQYFLLLLLLLRLQLQ